MDKHEIQLRIAELRALIEKANRDYYDLHQPTVGDRDYDLWEAELLRLEKENPEFATDDSPVRNVAGGVTEGFAKVTHDPPMQSLDKTHSKGELADFDTYIRSQLHSSPSSSSSPSPLTFTFRWLSEKDNGMYDALNKGIRMATGDVIGILNADDVLAEDDVLFKTAAAFADPTIDGTYGDIRFVKELGGKTVRYCSGRRFRPWMFRFGTQTAHPSTFFRKECFAKWGDYSLDYGMYGDFELLCRFIWKNRARMKYLPLCTTVMRMGGASTNGWRTTLKINRSDLRALKANGCWSCMPFLYARYFAKVWGFLV